ncbi:MAG: copper resistance protein CopC [Pseudomonadota bacterium]|nr:copper resistance protein CopC [Pseudomonadota bacterium]
MSKPRINRGLLVFAALACLPCNAHALKTLVIIENAAPAAPAQRLVSTRPYDNETLDKPPPAVVITFSQPIRPDKSQIRVYDSYGAPVSTGALSGGGTRMSVSLPKLPPGRYGVKWRESCLCEDETADLSDEFHFTIR